MHLATGLGLKAIEHGRVLFTTARPHRHADPDAEPRAGLDEKLKP